MTHNELPLLARQPILDRSLKTVAYELLCRPVPEDTLLWQNANGDLATSEVLISAFHDIGIDHVTGGLPAYINFTSYWLHNPPVLPANSLVAEVLEYIDSSNENIKALTKLKKLGYKIALDDYDGSDDRVALFPHVDIIKIDIRRLPDIDLLPSIIQRFQDLNLIWLAEKVETQHEYEICRAAGCHLFQGYFFSQPANIYGQRLPDSQLAVLQALQVLNDRNAQIDDIARVLKSDPQLSYKVLKVVNSSAFNCGREITSIQQAILMLGFNRLRAWANVIALGKLNKKPDVLREQAVVRAMLCKAMVFAWPELDEEMAFTIGLFSLLPAFLDHSMADIVVKMNLPASLSEPLVQLKGDYGLILSTAIAMEKGDWDSIDWDLLRGFGIEASQLERMYLSALVNTRELLSSFAA